jgi:hypothetical protein
MKRTSSLTTYLLPRLQDILFILVFYFLILFGSNLFRDGDPGRHITAGRYMLENRTILTRDIFSYTKLGQPLTPHEWLAQIAYGAFDLLLGLNGVVLLTALVIATTIVLVYREITHLGIPRLLAFGLALWAAAMTSAHWLARPHLFTLLFLAIWTPGLRRLSKGETAPLWLFPLIMLLWANTHGAFIAGFVVLAAYLAGWLWDRWRSSEKPSRTILRNLLIAGGTSFLVTFINPVGWRLWATSVGYVTNRYLVDLTKEYSSLDFHSPGAWPFLAFLALSLFVLTLAWKKLPTAERLLLAGWAALALYSGRNMPLFAVIATPIMALYIQPVMAGSAPVVKLTKSIDEIEVKLRGVFWSALTVGIVIILMASGQRLDFAHLGYQFNNIDFPVAAVDWLETNPQSGNMVDFFPWGGYLIYRMWPGQLVFIDGQLDFYGEQFTRQYQQIMTAGNDWRGLMAQYEINWMIVPPDQPIAMILANDPAWSVLYQDQTAVVLRKK